MDQHYTAKQAYNKLKLPRSTFYLLIKQGEIPEGIRIPLRKQALYNKAEIDRLADARNRLLQEYSQDRERFVFTIPNEDELKELVEVDKMVFHEETLIAPEEQLKWLQYNLEAIHVLKDIRTNTIVGGITISPLKREAMRKLISLEIDETELAPNDFVPYREMYEQDCYVIGIVAKPDIAHKYYAMMLIKATAVYLINLLERGITIKNLYTVAGTEEGEQLVTSLNFTKLPGSKEKLHEFRHPYVLNMQDVNNKSKIIQKYIKRIKVINRRLKRHMQSQS